MRFVFAAPLLLIPASCFAQVFSTGTFGFGGPAAQTNNPVSMVFEHKQTQTLADGTRISTVTHEYFYRDSLGRTRNETEFGPGWAGQGHPMRHVDVQDPVARTFTNWQAGEQGGYSRTYNQIDQNAPPPRVSTALVGTQSHTVVPFVRPQPDSRPRPKTTTEQLGTDQVQGVPCEATRITVVYPTDFFGNDRPVTTVTEHCQSRELGRMLRDSTEDPRSGTRTTVLQSISHGEPDPSLFLPPADYTDARAGVP